MTYIHIIKCPLCLLVQWGSRATRATPRCATGRTLCWTLTASPPSTPRLADPTITITTITIPRACVRTSNRAWCKPPHPVTVDWGSGGHSEAAGRSDENKHGRFHASCYLLFGGLRRGRAPGSGLTRWPPPCSQRSISGCETMQWRKRMKKQQRPWTETTLPIWTLTSVFFFKRSFRNTTFNAFAPVTRANQLYPM